MAKLRAVGPDEKPQPKIPKTITEAVESGTSRDVLASMRRILAQKLDDGDVSSNSLASVSKEMRELDRLIRQMDAHAAEAAAGKYGNADDESFDASAV